MEKVRYDVLTLFPELFQGFVAHGLIEKAIHKESLEIHFHDLCQWALKLKDEGHETLHGRADDRPFGGGDGVILRPEPIAAALDEIRAANDVKDARPVVYLTPDGVPFDAKMAQDLAGQGGAVLICGRYGGIDERIRTLYVDLEISIGDYVLMGGEIPAMVVMEASARYVPGVLGNSASAALDSFQDGMLEGPQYTRPREFKGLKVPEVLLSGDHQAIAHWRRETSVVKTGDRRPDLLHRR